MDNKYNHYIAVICFTGAWMAFIMFVYTELTMTIIAAFLALMMSMIYRSEYQFNKLKELIQNGR